MNLDNFDQKTSLIINTAYNYATENNYAYFTPLNILEILLSTNSEINYLLKELSVNIKEMYKEAKQLSSNTKRKKKKRSPKISDYLHGEERKYVNFHMM